MSLPDLKLPGRLEQRWMTYRAAVVPANADPKALFAVKVGFYAGARALMLEMQQIEKVETDDEAIKAAMDDIRRELIEFGRQGAGGTA